MFWNEWLYWQLTWCFIWYPHIIPFRLCHGTLVWYSKCYTLVCLSLTNTSDVCIPYSVTLWYHHISPSRLCHDTPVSYSGMGQSRIYAIAYSHLKAYVPIAIPNVAASHHISASRLCYNSTLVWLSLTNTPRMYVICLLLITCVLSASSSIRPSVCRILPHYFARLSVTCLPSITRILHLPCHTQCWYMVQL